MTRERVIVGVDVGTTKICALIGEVDHDNKLNIVGVGTTPSQGLRKGVVVDIDAATASIRAALDKTERISGYKIGTALVGIAGSHIASQNSRGIVAISPTMHEISQADVDRAVEAARAIPIPHTREVIHVIPREYIVDGQNGIHDPTGMSGYRLEVEAHIVTGAVASIHNLVKCVRNAGIEIDDLVLEPIASSEAVLTNAERDLGVALVDIGGGTTDVAVFLNGSILHTGIMAVGGNHLTNDLAVGLRASNAIAEEIKIRYGSVHPDSIDPNELIDVATFGNSSGEQISRRLVSEIMEMRAREMMEMVRDEIARANFQGVLPAGVVLTGGSSQVDGLDRLAGTVLGMPVRIGTPGSLGGLIDSISGPSFATSVGLLMWGLRGIDRVHEEPTPETFWSDAYARIRQMLRRFMP